MQRNGYGGLNRTMLELKHSKRGAWFLFHVRLNRTMLELKLQEKLLRMTCVYCLIRTLLELTVS